MNSITPDIIVKIAREWIGTPFHTQGRILGIGVDCLGLIMGVANSLSIKSKQGGRLADYDRNDYNLTMPNAAVMLERLSLHLEAEHDPSPKPGMVISIINHKQYGHLGIMTSDNTFIHACMLHNKVLEERAIILPHRTKLWRFHDLKLP